MGSRRCCQPAATRASDSAAAKGDRWPRVRGLTTALLSPEPGPPAPPRRTGRTGRRRPGPTPRPSGPERRRGGASAGVGGGGGSLGVVELRNLLHPAHELRPLRQQRADVLEGEGGLALLAKERLAFEVPELHAEVGVGLAAAGARRLDALRGG